MDDIDLPDNLFDAAALVYVEAGATIEQARDWIILQCLEGGETSAFVYFETLGHQPGREVLRMLSLMLTDAMHIRDPGQAIAPFALIAKRRDGKAGRRDGPLVEMRNQLIALNVKALIDGGMKADAAIPRVALMISEEAKIKKGRSVKEETVRKAWQEFFAGK